MTRKEYKKSKTITKMIDGHKIVYIPLIHNCTYHDTNNRKKLCINCNNTGYYTDGYYMIVSKGKKKIGFTVDNIN